CKKTIPFVLKWITDIQTDNILLCKVLFCKKTFCFFQSIHKLSEYIIHMTVTQFLSYFLFIGVYNFKTIGILWPQLCVTFLESIFIQFKFKRIQILVSRAV